MMDPQIAGFSSSPAATCLFTTKFDPRTIQNHNIFCNKFGRVDK